MVIECRPGLVVERFILPSGNRYRLLLVRSKHCVICNAESVCVIITTS